MSNTRKSITGVWTQCFALAAVICMVAFTGPVATAQQELSFTVKRIESTLSGSSGSTLGTITPEDVAVVSPWTGVYSAETFANHLNFNTFTGDGDGDAFYHSSPMADAIDALDICSPGVFTHTLRDLFFSTKKPVPCAGGGLIEPGDVSAVAMNAVSNVFIDDLQIRDALGITPNTPFFDIDAITRDNTGSIYLSFEADVPILLGTVMLRDGGVAYIPASAITYSGCNVIAVVPLSGNVAFTENEANLMTVNASVADNGGNFIQVIFDLDGLEVDPNGGTFTASGGTFPNLIFSGEYYTGGGILSTAGGGSIAVINGIPMATAFPGGPTDGSQVGLAPTGFVSSLDGLALAAPTCRFILDTQFPYMPGPGFFNFTAGGADPFQPVYYYARIFSVNAAGGFQNSVPLLNPCFPEWFLNNTYLFPLPSDALGIVNFTSPYGGGVPAGNTVLLQGVTLKAIGWSLSVPITIQF